jgi:subtilisin
VDHYDLSRLIQGSMRKSDYTGVRSPVIIRLKDHNHFKECCRHLSFVEHRMKKLGWIDGISCHLHPDEWDALKKHPLVRHVEKDITVKLHMVPTPTPSTKPPSHKASRQRVPWGVRKIGIPKLSLDASNASTISVGILDTGVDLKHPDLAGNLAGGINILSPFRPPADDSGHGTHVTGTVAAVNNAMGVVGVAPSTKIYAIKCFDKDGNGSISDIVRGIEWAVNQRIRVLNLSFGSNQPSDALREAIRRAYQKGMILVASAGNDGTPRSVDYPARYPEVLAVGATNKSNRMASFSSRGVQVDLVAPGEDILSTGLNGNYEVMSGTSMASPHVSGLVARMLSLYPNLKPAQVHRVLKRTAIKLKSTPRSAQGAGYTYAPRIFRFLKRRLR